MNKNERLPVLEYYKNNIDKSNFNTETGDYVKGMVLIHDMPTITGEKYIESGKLSIIIHPLLSDSNKVHLILQHFKDDGTQNNLHVLLSQDTCRQIGNIVGSTIFDSKLRPTTVPIGIPGHLEDVT